MVEIVVCNDVLSLPIWRPCARKTMFSRNFSKKRNQILARDLSLTRRIGFRSLKVRKRRHEIFIGRRRRLGFSYSLGNGNRWGWSAWKFDQHGSSNSSPDEEAAKGYELNTGDLQDSDSESAPPTFQYLPPRTSMEHTVVKFPLRRLKREWSESRDIQRL